MIFMIVVFLFPAVPDPTSESMNYTIVVVGGVVALSLGYYFFPKYGGRHWFIGPVETIREVETAESVTDDEKDSKNSKRAE